jgi:excisionase family DNA binding protein
MFYSERGHTMADEWLTVGEIAKELKVGDDTVRSWIKGKEGTKLQAFNIGGKRPDYRIKREWLDNFILSRTV